MVQMQVKKVRPGAAVPVRATALSAGYDLSACLEAPLTIPAGGRAKVPTGIAVAIPAGAAGFIFVRSGLGVKRGLVLSNAVGVIDADYRGELMVGLSNHSEEDYTIAPGERFAQLVLLPILTPELVESDALDDTDRGAGGFGSTGRRVLP